jgi:hypothetical protein
VPSGFLDDEIYFTLWALVAFIGFIRLLTESFLRGSRPRRIVHQMAGGLLLFAGIVFAIPHAPKGMRFYRELLTPAPIAERTVLAQDQIIDGIAFQAGSAVAVMPDGKLSSAELQRPHLIDGLSVIGHATFFRVSVGGGAERTRLYEGTLAADQEIPNSGGVWCSPKRPVRLNLEFETGGLTWCEVARMVTIDGVNVPPGSFLTCTFGSWDVELPVGDPVLVDGVSVPGGWNFSVLKGPPSRISSLYIRSDTPNARRWVELHGVRLTGFINFTLDSAMASGDLLEDTTIDGVLHKKGESVQVSR